jgi:sulfatase maturation enzyme AslB (radical SAM superfamily)
MIAVNSGVVLPYIFDVELSGRCNTWCTFCPRDEMKRGEQFMSEEHFEHFFDKFRRYVNALDGREVFLPHERAKAVLTKGEASPVRIILCGMGESLMHPKCAEWVGRMRSEIGVRVTIVTNGLLLKESMLDKLIAAQVTVLLVSIPGIDRESYTKYIPLDWDRVLGNVERAHARLPGRVHINVTLPDDTWVTPEQVMAFWGARGIPIASLNHCHNRGGFLKDGHLTGRFGESGSHFCGIIARHNFVAWDGRVLSCCHDLHAENVLGHVSSDEFLDIAVRKTPVVEDANYRICRSCNDGERLQPAQIIRTLTLRGPAQLTGAAS